MTVVEHDLLDEDVDGDLKERPVEGRDGQTKLTAAKHHQMVDTIEERNSHHRLVKENL